MKLTYKNLEQCNLYALRKIGKLFGVKSPTSQKAANLIKEILKQQEEIEKSIENFNVNKLEQEYKLDKNILDYLIQLYGIKKSTIKPYAIVKTLKDRQMQYANIIYGKCDIIHVYDPDAKTGETIDDFPDSDEETENQNSAEKKLTEELQEVKDGVKKAVKDCVNKILKLQTDFSLKQQLVRILQPFFDTVFTDYEDMIYLTMLKDVLSL